MQHRWRAKFVGPTGARTEISTSPASATRVGLLQNIRHALQRLAMCLSLFVHIASLCNACRLVAKHPHIRIQITEVRLALKEWQPVADAIIARRWWALPHHDLASFFKLDGRRLHDLTSIFSNPATSLSATCSNCRIRSSVTAGFS